MTIGQAYPLQGTLFCRQRIPVQLPVLLFILSDTHSGSMIKGVAMSFSYGVSL
jgi:hypothetical protein